MCRMRFRVADLDSNKFTDVNCVSDITWTRNISRRLIYEGYNRLLPYNANATSIENECA